MGLEYAGILPQLPNGVNGGLAGNSRKCYNTRTMQEFVFRSTSGRCHFSLRTRGPQTVGQLAEWLNLPADTVFKALASDDRIGWAGWPVKDVENVLAILVTKGSSLRTLIEG